MYVCVSVSVSVSVFLSVCLSISVVCVRACMHIGVCICCINSQVVMFSKETLKICLALTL